MSCPSLWYWGFKIAACLPAQYWWRGHLLQVSWTGLTKADCWLCPFQRSLKIISVISPCFLKSPFPLCHLHNPPPSLRERLGSGQQRLLYVEEGYMLCSHLHHLTLTAVGATHFWIFGLTLGLVFLPVHPVVATVAEFWHAPPCWNTSPLRRSCCSD